MSFFTPMMTAIVLHSGGFEANALAAWVIEYGEKWGTLVFKFVIVAIVLCLCEWVGRLDRASGQRLWQLCNAEIWYRMHIDGGDLVLRAGNRVSMVDGFSVEHGGALTVELDAALQLTPP